MQLSLEYPLGPIPFQPEIPAKFQVKFHPVHRERSKDLTWIAPVHSLEARSCTYDKVQPVAMAMIRHLVPLLVVLLTSCGSSNLEKMLIEAAHYGEVDKMSLLIDRGANVLGDTERTTATATDFLGNPSFERQPIA